MPYIFDAFRHPVYGIRSISNLFNPVATILGPDESRKQLLPIIQTALNPEKTTNYHWHCFTRRFQIQLIARFGLNKYLQIFPILLIEACSGFKDETNILIEDANESNSDADESNHDRSDTITPQDCDSNTSDVKLEIGFHKI